ncbi:MAG: hypothetical protein IKT32_05925, partial [Clostridia bacterium]|nr:hypothetical protein [Clostridia bacterium]
MKKTRNITLLLLVCVCIFSLFGAVSVIAQNESTEVKLVPEVQIEEVYALGTELTIPDAQMHVAGKTYNTQTVLHYPNGDTTSSKAVVLDHHGKYLLEYKASTNEGVKVVTKTFLVNEYLYSTDSRSSAVYGKNDLAPRRPG